MFIAVLSAVLIGDFLLIKYAVTIFLVDILIRVFINLKFSPTLIMGRLVVRNQVPEYVGAPQKKFAWIIGSLLASIIFSLLVVANTVSPITGIICLICLTFLFFETAFGICLGCKCYPLFFKQETLYCPGDVCAADSKQKIQKTSKSQVFVVISFIAFIFATAILFDDQFNTKPYDLFGITGSAKLI